MFIFSASFYCTRIIIAREIKTIIQHLQKVIPLSQWVEDILRSQIKIDESVRAVCYTTVAEHVLRLVGQATLRKRQLKTLQPESCSTLEFLCVIATRYRHRSFEVLRS